MPAIRDNKVEPAFNVSSSEKVTPQTSNLQYGHGIREILPQIMNEQNRKTYGTWQRKFDFTRTLIGYLLGIHSFFRIPYLTYKYGGVFFIPYFIMMKCVAVPTVFMEFTIGQYYGVCSYVAFTHMSPILSCVSKLLTWSCVVNCWMYAVMMAWLRVYASDSTSCVKGWEVCDQNHFYNSPHCWTGMADDMCNDPALAALNGIAENVVLSGDLLFYNFHCTTVEDYCKLHGWEVVPGARRCVDGEGQKHTMYERRYHAMQEYFYGAVLGLQRNMNKHMKSVIINETLGTLGTDIHGLREEIYNKTKYGPHHPLYNKTDEKYQIESVRIYMKKLQNSRDPADREKYLEILKRVAAHEHQQVYWTRDGRRLSESEDSSSYIDLQQVSVTTWIMIGVFLFEDLLKISGLSYFLNALPFSILIYVTVLTVRLPHAGYGIKHIFQVKRGFWKDLTDLEMWGEATVQAIYASGIGSGCLISLSTFNNFDATFLFDLYFTLGLCLVSACCGVLISFGSIGHYLRFYDIDVPFWEYIRSCSSTSSIEFCFLAYSHFLTLMSEHDRGIVILWFFFMVTSFATDTAVRLIQNVLETVHAISPRLKHHSTMVLVAVCVMGYLILVPVMKNGGYVLFIDFEYFVTQYMMPLIVAVEIGACVFLYTASRLVDHAEQMGVFTSYLFRVYMTGLLYASFTAVLLTVIVNFFHHRTTRFNGLKSDDLLEMFGWVFFVSPFLMGILSVVKHLIVVPARQRRYLLVPSQGKDRKNRRGFLRRAQGNRHKQEATDHEQVRAAAQRMRILESKFVLALVKEKKMKEQQEAAAANNQVLDTTSNNNEPSYASRRSLGQPSLPPLYASMVRGAAAEFGKERLAVPAFHRRKSPSHLSVSMKSESLHHPVLDEVEAKVGLIARIKSMFTTLKNCFRKSEEVVARKRSKLEEEEEEKEEARLKYLDIMDGIERWPGRLDESEIESEGSSVDGSDGELDHGH